MNVAAAGTHLRLKPNVDVLRQVIRGEVWYVCHDRALDRIFRVSQVGGEILSRLDGLRAPSDVLSDYLDDHPDTEEDATTLRRFLGRLEGLGLLVGGGSERARTGAPERQARQTRRRKILDFLRNPASFRITLFDPEPLLQRLAPVTPWLFGRLGLTIWAALCLVGGVLAFRHWPELTRDVVDRVVSLQNLPVAMLAYPFIKVLHEGAHALALKHCGCEVRRVGLVVVAGFPMPYVDATVAMTLPNKYDRILISSAGILAELLLFSVMMVLWTVSEPGLLRTFSYNVVILTGLSTLLFNGNPLQRFDGYYVLVDLVEMPDLATRAAQWVGHLGKRHLLGRASTPPRIRPEERGWFLVYGIASWIYRSVLTIGIALYIADSLPFVGGALAVWTIVGALAVPVQGIVDAARDGEGGDRARGALRLSLVVAGLAGLLFLMPLPSGIVSRGYVLLPDEAQIKSDASGRLPAWAVPSGATVAAGTTIARLENLEIDVRLRRARAAVAEMEASYTDAAATGPVQAQIAGERLAEARRELDVAVAEVARLAVVAKQGGVLLLDRPADRIGAWIGRGDALGIVRPTAPAVVRTVVPHWQIDRIRRGAEGVSVRLGYRPLDEVAGRILRIVPSAGDVLPSPALALDGGGPFAVTNRDQEGLHTAEVLFRIDVELPTATEVDYFNGRADVRFDLGSEPAGYQIYRALRLVFLRHFHV